MDRKGCWISILLDTTWLELQPLISEYPSNLYSTLHSIPNLCTQEYFEYVQPSLIIYRTNYLHNALIQESTEDKRICDFEGV